MNYTSHSVSPARFHFFAILFLLLCGISTQSSAGDLVWFSVTGTNLLANRDSFAVEIQNLQGKVVIAITFGSIPEMTARQILLGCKESWDDKDSGPKLDSAGLKLQSLLNDPKMMRFDQDDFSTKIGLTFDKIIRIKR